MPRGGRTHQAPNPTSRRTHPMPIGWKRIRANALHRDGYQCTVVDNGQRCTETQHLEVDHLGDADDHSLDNLATKCKRHHATKTGQDAAAARLARRADRTPRPRPHPGLTA